MSLHLTLRARDAMVKAAADAYGCTPDEILGPRRFKRIAHARQYAMWLLREVGYSYPEIGRKLGRDHASVIHGVRAHEARYGWSLCGELAA